MLQTIRDRSSGILAKIIVGLIAVTFVVTGVNFFSTGSDDTVIAQVGDVEVTEREFTQRLDQERRQLLQMLSDPTAIDENVLRQRVFNALIEQAAVVHYAGQIGMGAPDPVLDQVIIEIPEFQRDGRFDPALYDQTLGQMGLSRLGFKAELEKNILDYQLRGAVEASTLIFPSELERLAALQAQTRSGTLAVIETAQYARQIDVSETEVDAYYADNQNTFLSEEQVELEYVTLDADDFAERIEITDVDLRQAYEAEVAVAENASERRARHILINASDDALERIEALRTEILNGQDFAAVAREHSDDIASRDLGGDLGFIPAGSFVPEFEAALNDLPLNTVSEPVETPFGYHLIEVLEIRNQPVESFEERVADLRIELETREAERLLRDSVEEFSNIAFSGTLEELQSIYGVTIESSPALTRAGGEGVLSNQTLIRRAFDESLRDGTLNAEVFEVEPGRFMTFRVKTFKPAEIQPLEVVRSQIIERLNAEKIRERADADAEMIKTHWQTGATGLPQGLYGDAIDLITFTDTPREGSDAVDANRIAAAFGAPAPAENQISTAIESFGDQRIVARVTDMTLGDVDLEVVGQLQDAVTQLRVTQEGSEYWNVVLNASEVVRP
jgi:peptidyl-prolyl cis-trans isomerase D